MSDRRSFLRGLATLPLIGGSVTLIGQPTAAAVPITDALLERYTSWLIHEHLAVQKIRMLRVATSDAERALIVEGIPTGAYGFRTPPAVHAHIASADPVTRAAVVLSAVGCPLSNGGGS